jgi:hypothetical protein
MSELKLQPKLIEETIERLWQRINDRFPGAGLAKVCEQLLQISRRAERKSIWLGRPHYGLRLLTAIVIGLIITGSVAQVLLVDWQGRSMAWNDWIQGTEALANQLVLIGAAIFFLVTLESRYKRRRGLAAIHELRSIAHIIDMHQLTKDPERAQSKVYQATQASPQVTLDGFLLRRYLDYCSEMLALTGKIAAEYVNSFNDSVMVAAVNDIETLTTDLSRKIWQKIMILHSFENESNKAPPLPAPVAKPTAPSATAT